MALSYINFIFKCTFVCIWWPNFDNIKLFRSEFRDIYDEDHFIANLEGYVKVVKEVPEELMLKYENNITNVPSFRVQAWASVSYYLGEVYPVLQQQGYASNHCIFSLCALPNKTVKILISESQWYPQTELRQTSSLNFPCKDD